MASWSSPVRQAAPARNTPEAAPAEMNAPSAPVSRAMRAPAFSCNSSRCTNCREASTMASTTSGGMIEPPRVVMVPPGVDEWAQAEAMVQVRCTHEFLPDVFFAGPTCRQLRRTVVSCPCRALFCRFEDLEGMPAWAASGRDQSNHD